MQHTYREWILRRHSLPRAVDLGAVPPFASKSRTRHVPCALAKLTQLVRQTHQGALGHTTLVNFYSRVPSVLITPWCELVSASPELCSNSVRTARVYRQLRHCRARRTALVSVQPKRCAHHFQLITVTGVFRNEASAQ